MSERSPWRALAGTAMASLLPVSSVLADEPVTSYLNVRVPTQVAPEVVKTIARIGVSETLNLTAGVSIQSIVAERCGAADPVYLKLLIESNPGLVIEDLPKLRSSRSVEFPACAVLPAPKVKPVQPGDNIASIAKANRISLNLEQIELNARKPAPAPTPALSRSDQGSGGGMMMAADPSPSPQVPVPVTASANLAGIQYEKIKQITKASPFDPPAAPKEIKQITKEYYSAANTQAFLKANPTTDPRRLQPGTNITLPGAEPAWSSIRLKPGIPSEQGIHEISAAIAAEGASPEGKVEKASLASLIGPVSGDPNAICDAPTPQEWAWPLRIGQLTEILAINREERARRQIDEQEQKPKILILDTGFDFSKEPGMAFAGGYLSQVRGLAPLTGGFQNATGWVPGVNLYTNENTPVSLQGYADRWHGLGVAGVALGGRPLEPLRRYAPLPVRVAFANVVKATGDGYEIGPNALYRAIGFAVNNGISIINASLSISEKSEALGTALNEHHNMVLLVNAAGNDGKRMDDKPIWPAAYGGEQVNAGRATVVTVGAHDGNGNIARFSRHSSYFVDLLAPGCNVPTYTGHILENGKMAIRPASMTGTSFAAPVVSFIAALLNYEGLRVPEIKARLVTSVDARGDLDERVYSRGKLNATKALAVWHDVVEVRDGNRTEIKLGRVTNKGDPFTLCKHEFRLSEARKLALTPGDGEAPSLHLWKASSDESEPAKMQRRPLCEAKDINNQALKFEDARTGESTSIPLSKVADYVPAWFPEAR